MAKYTVTHKCGHEKEHNLIGPRRSREWKIKRMEEELCHVCEAAEQERKNAEAAAANKEMGLPDLVGTEKQVAWAESIRLRLMEELDQLITEGKSQGGTLNKEGQILIDTLMAQNEASWWIDVRNHSVNYVLELIADHIRRGQVKAVHPEDNTKAALEAKAEATIRPTEAKTETVVEIRIVGDNIEVEFPERNEVFRQLIRYELGYSWTGAMWRRESGLFGTAEDRVAETGHRLLASGFPIRIYDADLRQRVIDGDFEPEPKRVIYSRNDGAYDGWFAISWPQSDSYYNTAISLPGARWDRPHVVVPAESFEVVVGFAETYGFALSPGAQALVESVQVAKEAELIAPPIKPKKPAKGRKPSDVPEPLEVPEDVEIDDSLRDDD